MQNDYPGEDSRIDEIVRRDQEDSERRDRENAKRDADERIRFGKEVASNQYLNMSERLRNKHHEHGYQANRSEYNAKVVQEYDRRFDKQDYDKMDNDEQEQYGGSAGQSEKQRSPTELCVEKFLAYAGELAPKYHTDLIKRYMQGASFSEWAKEKFEWYTTDNLTRSDVGLSNVAVRWQDYKDTETGLSRSVMKSIICMPSAEMVTRMIGWADDIRLGLSGNVVPKFDVDLFAVIPIIVAFRTMFCAYDKRTFCAAFIGYSKIKVLEEIIFAIFIEAGMAAEFTVSLALCESMWNALVADMKILYAIDDDYGLQYLRQYLACSCMRMNFTFSYLSHGLLFQVCMDILKAGKPFTLGNDTITPALFSSVLGIKCESKSVYQLLRERRWPMKQTRDVRVKNRSKLVRVVPCNSLVNLVSANGRWLLAIPGSEIDSVSEQLTGDIFISRSRGYVPGLRANNMYVACICAINQTESLNSERCIRYDTDSNMFYTTMVDEDDLPTEDTDGLVSVLDLKEEGQEEVVRILEEYADINTTESSSTCTHQNLPDRGIIKELFSTNWADEQ